MGSGAACAELLRVRVTSSSPVAGLLLSRAESVDSTRRRDSEGSGALEPPNSCVSRSSCRCDAHLLTSAPAAVPAGFGGSPPAPGGACCAVAGGSYCHDDVTHKHAREKRGDAADGCGSVYRTRMDDRAWRPSAPSVRGGDFSRLSHQTAGVSALRVEWPRVPGVHLSI